MAAAAAADCFYGEGGRPDCQKTAAAVCRRLEGVACAHNFEIDDTVTLKLYMWEATTLTLYKLYTFC